MFSPNICIAKTHNIYENRHGSTGSVYQHKNGKITKFEEQENIFGENHVVEKPHHLGGQHGHNNIGMGAGSIDYKIFNYEKSIYEHFYENCFDVGDCIFNGEKDTMDYITELTSSDQPILPTNPVKGSLKMNFKRMIHHGQKNNGHIKEFEQRCKNHYGMVCYIDFDATLKGSMLNLFQTDLQIESLSTPLCLSKVCSEATPDEFSDVFFEIALELVKIDLARNEKLELSDDQASFLKSLNSDNACDVSGLDVCDLEVKELSCNYHNKFSDMHRDSSDGSTSFQPNKAVNFIEIVLLFTVLWIYAVK